MKLIYFLLTVTVAGALKAEPGLPRLFTTPAERSEIERRMSEKGQAHPPISKRADGSTPAVEPQSLKINGYVYGRGREIAWINGKVISPGHSLAPGLSLLTGGKPPDVRLRFNDERPTTVKVGDVVDFSTRAIHRIRVRSD